VNVEVPLSQGSAFLVEGDVEAGVVRAGRGRDAIAAGAETFQDSLAKVGQIAEMIVQRFATATRGPDRVRAEFGIKLSAETGMVVVKGTADAHFVLELEWTRHEGAEAQKETDRPAGRDTEDEDADAPDRAQDRDAAAADERNAAAWPELGAGPA